MTENTAKTVEPAGLSNKSMRNIPFSMTLTDPRQKDNPLVFVNKAFELTTGYSADDAVGRNCRFLQGPATDPIHVAAIREALKTETEIAIDILNYRKDGTSFLNRLLITPIYADDDDSELISFLGIQTSNLDASTDANRAEALRTRIQELQHRVKNHLSMVLSLVRVDQRSSTPEQVVTNLTRRVASLGELYDQLASTAGAGGEETLPLGAYLSRICATTQDLTDPGRILVNVDLEAVDVPGEVASQIGMFVSEVLNNALQHAFGHAETGEVSVTMKLVDDYLRVTVEDNGCGLGDSEWPNSGSLGGRIVTDMARILRGTLTVESEAGTSVSLAIPSKYLQT